MLATRQLPSEPVARFIMYHSRYDLKNGSVLKKILHKSFLLRSHGFTAVETIVASRQCRILPYQFIVSLRSLRSYQFLNRRLQLCHSSVLPQAIGCPPVQPYSATWSHSQTIAIQVCLNSAPHGGLPRELQRLKKFLQSKTNIHGDSAIRSQYQALISSLVRPLTGPEAPIRIPNLSLRRNHWFIAISVPALLVPPPEDLIRAVPIVVVTVPTLHTAVSVFLLRMTTSGIIRTMYVASVDTPMVG